MSCSLTTDAICPKDDQGFSIEQARIESFVEDGRMGNRFFVGGDLLHECYLSEGSLLDFCDAVVNGMGAASARRFSEAPKEPSTANATTYDCINFIVSSQ